MGAVIPKTCENCGRSFLTRDKNKKFCDVKCEEDYRDGIVVKPRANEFTADSKVCKNCGRTFYRRYCEGLEVFEKRKYCCLSCASSGSNIKKGEKMVTNIRRFKNVPVWVKDLFERKYDNCLSRQQVEVINRFCAYNSILAVDDISFEDEYKAENSFFGEGNMLCCTLVAERYLYRDNERKEILRYYRRLNEE